MANEDMAGRIMAHAFNDELEKISAAVDPATLIDIAQMLGNYGMARAAFPIARDAVRGAMGKAPIRKGGIGTRYLEALEPQNIARDAGNVVAAGLAAPQTAASTIRDAARGALGKRPVHKGTPVSRFTDAQRKHFRRLRDFVRDESSGDDLGALSELF